MSEPADAAHDPLVEALISQGVTLAQIDECRRISSHGSAAAMGTVSEATSDHLDSLRGRSVLEVLVALGYLTAEAARRIAPLLRPTVEPCSTAHDTGGKTSAPSAGPRRLGKYELVQELGRGGMGVVYRAWHPGLKAPFAVKVLLAGDDASSEAMRRFHQEAQVSAKLRHPGIVAVVDIGEQDGKTWFSMEYVDGIGLDKVVADPRAAGVAPAAGEGAGGIQARAAVRMAQEIAEAVQAAHDAGVIHRDLKPANVLRDREGRLKVTDFGLARIVDAGGPQGTRTGTLMGTPAYMSPEQAGGRIQEVDERSDVYQLGAILYELLTGRPPFEGATPMEVVLDVMHRDPLAPRRRNPLIERDAETICLKAMARNRARRYASARELAADCRRLLDGEAILARPEAWWEKGLRVLRRRRLLAGAAAAVAIASTVAGYGLWEKARLQVENRRQEDEQRRLREEMVRALGAVADSNVKAVLGIRRAGGDLREAEREFLAPLAENAGKAIQEAPGLALPHYYLGRMLRAMQRFDAARREQDQALAKEPGFAPSRYERAILASRAYGLRLAELAAQWARDEGARLAVAGALESGAAAPRSAPARADLAARDPAAVALRQTLREDIESLEASGASSAGDGSSAVALSDAQRHCARGLFLLLFGDPQDLPRGLELLSQALAADPLLEEAHEWTALEQSDRGDFAAAVATLTHALELDKGNVSFLSARAAAVQSWAIRDAAVGEDALPRFEAAEADLARAVAFAPRDAVLRRTLGIARSDLAQARAERGDPSAELRSLAVEDLRQSLELAPEDPVTLVSLARIHLARAIADQQAGRDPDGAYADAEAALARVEPAAGAPAGLWAVWELMLTDRALHEENQGRDPDLLFRRAVECARRQVECDPTVADPWMGLGAAHHRFGSSRSLRGLDPLPEFAEARECFDRAVQRDPDSSVLRHERGNLYADWGTWLSDSGGDPEEFWRRAEADYDESLKRNPHESHAWMKRAALHLNRARAVDRSGADPVPRWEKALSDLAEATRLDPASAEAWRRRGEVWADLLRRRLGFGGDAAGAREEALRACNRAIELDPGMARAWCARGRCRAEWASAAARRGERMEEEYRAALADFTRALELNPKLAEALERRAFIQRERASLAFWRGEDPSALQREAGADIDRALAATPDAPRLLALRAHLALERAQQAMASGADPAPFFTAAGADLDRAIEADALHPDYLSLRGMLRCAQGEHAARLAAGDPLAWFRQAESDLSRSMAIQGPDAESLYGRGRLRALTGEQELARDLDPRSSLEGARDDLDRVIGLGHASVDVEMLRALVDLQLGRWDDALAGFAALQKKDPARAAAFGTSQVLAVLGKAAGARGLEWVHGYLKGDLATARHDQAAARERFLQWLKTRDEVRADLPAERRAAFDADAQSLSMLAHYGVACGCAVLSADSASPGAAALVDEAFEHLRAAIAAGFTDRAWIEQDADLVPLHRDARWAAILQALGGSGR